MWKLYATAQGCLKTLSATLQNFVGKSINTIELGFLSAIVIGTVQMIGGLIGVVGSSRRQTLRVLFPNNAVFWAIGFGLTAGIFGTALSIYTYTLGAEFAARTLLFSASIVPGAILGRIFWGAKTDPLGVQQWIGIALFLVACWLTLVVALSGAIGECFSRKIAEAHISPWTKNFWTGTTTLLANSTIFAVVIMFSTNTMVISQQQVFYIGSIAVGLVVVGMTTFMFLSYAGGGTVALKKLITESLYLITFTMVGVFAYSQPFTIGHVIAFTLFFPAFVLLDKEASNFVRSQFTRLKPV